MVLPPGNLFKPHPVRRLPLLDCSTISRLSTILTVICGDRILQLLCARFITIYDFRHRFPVWWRRIRDYYAQHRLPGSIRVARRPGRLVSDQLFLSITRWLST